MALELYQQLARVIDPALCLSADVYRSYRNRLRWGRYVRSENTKTHFCVYFLPYNPASHEVFLVHHKKSGLWLSPGGHIEEGESLEMAIRREAQEELHLRVRRLYDPFLLTVTPIENPAQRCQRHYDIWHLLPVRPGEVDAVSAEFFRSKWVPVHRVNDIVTDLNNRAACAKITIMRDHHMLTAKRYSYLFA